MTENRIRLLNEKYLKQIPSYAAVDFSRACAAADDSCFEVAINVPVKSKVVTAILSLFLGGLGVDRFYIGDIGLGCAKLIVRILSFILLLVPALNVIGVIAVWVSSIWCFIDIFVAYKKCKLKNYRKFIAALPVAPVHQRLNIPTM